MLKKSKILAGYDINGTVYDAHEYIRREIVPSKKALAQEIYDLYKKHNLEKLGIVETEKLADDAHNCMILKHKKHVISYPHEWTISMFKESMLFHLELFIKLDKYGLTLKDALPNNIVFNFNTPVFVDFLSLSTKEKLHTETWLYQINNHTSQKTEDLQYLIFNTMFFPYFFIPFIMLSRKDYVQTRAIMRDHACNISTQKPSWSMLLNKSTHKTRMQRYGQTLKLYLFLTKIKKLSFIEHCKALHNYCNAIDIAPKNSAYLAYYEKKNENFSFTPQSTWQNKQKNVYNAIKAEQPHSVLDLGANTGWFSILAAKLGASVIATDIDEASIDYLHHYAQENNLNILTLMLPFENLTQKTFGLAQTDPAYQTKDFKNNPIFLAATDRLQSDLVLCLALIHHLVLGAGLEINTVIKTLAQLSNKTLVLEFVDISDPLIQSDQSFFKNIHKHSPLTYNLDLIIKTGLNYFKTYKIVESHPEERRLIIFSK